MSKKIRFIINPISGGKQKDNIAQLITDSISKDFEVDIQMTKAPGHASELSLEAKNESFDAVIAVGGDGTVNEVAQSIIHSSVAFGLVPTGSGNGFARHLQIPLNIEDSLQVIKRFEHRLIDTAMANEKSFLVTAGTGFDSFVAQEFAKNEKRGFFSYIQICAREFKSYLSKNYEWEIDGKAESSKAFIITIANAGQYGNDVWIAPNASLSDGLLNMTILQKFPATSIPKIILQLLNKSIGDSAYYREIKGKDICIKNVDSYHIDGEPFNLNGDLHLKIQANSLRVIC